MPEFTEREAELCELAATDCDAVTQFARFDVRLRSGEYRALAEKIRAHVPVQGETLFFKLPLPENLANARMHWRTKEKFRSEYFARLDLMYAARMVPRAPGGAFTWPSASVAVELVMPNPMDEDNAVARCKWPLDWIVRRGYLAGDSRKQLTWGSMPAQTISRVKGEAAIHITLTKSGVTTGRSG